MADDHKSDTHVIGSMDIEEQEKTFAAFLGFIGRGMAVCIVALILLYLING